MATIDELFVRADGGWRQCAYSLDNNLHGAFVRVNGSYRRVEEGYVRVNGAWRKFFGPGDEVEPPPDRPDPGSYDLAATALWLDTGGVGYAEFNTSAYRGYISEIRAKLTWTNTSLVNTTIRCWGRPNGNFYRDIDNNNQEWNGRTIEHRIDSFDASSLTDFNSGAAIGFNLEVTSSANYLSTLISNVRLVLEIS